ncbi:hypothetical protein GCK32_011179 [Trichostrongylus colubriformis]|uniref:Uncharacterized protein n=1 Tax=Trichostrongylus colubriformis TaxID=6319 RepID=A0AAN8EZ48_TRICO
MADLEPVQPSLCQRICCCMTTSAKEPPVQLIRSGALDVPRVANGHISAAENTIDGFEDINLSSVETGTKGDSSEPSRNSAIRRCCRCLPTPHLTRASYGSCGPDDPCVITHLGVIARSHHFQIQDVISISTNVIEEVDEAELSRLRLHPSCEILLPEKSATKEPLPFEAEQPPEAELSRLRLHPSCEILLPEKSATKEPLPFDAEQPPSEDDDDHRNFYDAREERDDHDRNEADNDDKGIVARQHSIIVVEQDDVSLSMMEMPSTSTATDDRRKSKSEEEETITEETVRENEFSESEKELESEISSAKLEESPKITQNPRDSAGPSVIKIVPKEDVESDTDDEIILAAHVTSTAKRPYEPPSIPTTKSIMYADTSSSDDDSGDEDSREIMPPVQRSQRFTNIDQLRTDQTINGLGDSQSTLVDDTIKNRMDSSSSSEDELIREARKRASKEDNGGAAVTKIIVRDNGLPDVLTSGNGKMNAETITDEEFSEKLI